MKRAVVASLVMLTPALAMAQDSAKPLKVGSINASSARTVAQFDDDAVKGRPTRLVWSTDGSELYLQTTQKERGRVNTITSHHVFSATDGKMKKVDNEPAWARTGWAAKSDRSSPDKSTFMIDVGSEKRVARSVSPAMGGEMARGGLDGGGAAGGGAGGTTSDDAISAAQGTQNATVLTLKLGGQVIGEFVNEAIVPGATFGWGPKGTGAIVYSKPDNGRLVVMNVDGKTQELSGIDGTLLPVFSLDGTKVAFLKRDGRNKYALQVVQFD